MPLLNFCGKIIIITGHTATGKTHLAIQLANDFNGEIINADSRQVYCGLDIGTGKDLKEYQLNNQNIKHHLIDICQPTQKFSLFDFKNQAIDAMNSILKKGKLPIICGGTPLYIDALVNNYQFVGNAIKDDFEQKFSNYSYEQLTQYFQDNYANRSNDFDLSQKRRLIRAIELIESGEQKKIFNNFTGDSLIIAPLFAREIIYQRIEQRLEKRWEALIDEVKNLKKNNFITSTRLQELGLEYRYIDDFLERRLSEKECYDSLYQAIRKFAKRQATWFRKLEKNHKIHWVESYQNAQKTVKEFLI